jgi:hypothetical protein
MKQDPTPHIYKLLKKLGSDINDNVEINNIPFGTWLNYFQVDES